MIPVRCQTLYGSSRCGFALIQVVQTDITKETTDAIVNAANHNLKLGGGVAGAINRSGGPSIQKECNAWISAHRQVETGQAVLTTAGKLPCRGVIHAVGPYYNKKNPRESEINLRKAIHNSLLIADEQSYQSISLPAISSGIFGYPKEDCAKVFMETVTAYLSGCNKNLRMVRLTNFDSLTTEVFQTEFNRHFLVVDVSLDFGLDGVSFDVVYEKPGVLGKGVVGKQGKVGKTVKIGAPVTGKIEKSESRALEKPGIIGKPILREVAARKTAGKIVAKGKVGATGKVGPQAMLRQQKK